MARAYIRRILKSRCLRNIPRYLHDATWETAAVASSPSARFADESLVISRPRANLQCSKCPPEKNIPGDFTVKYKFNYGIHKPPAICKSTTLNYFSIKRRDWTRSDARYRLNKVARSTSTPMSSSDAGWIDKTPPRYPSECSLSKSTDRPAGREPSPQSRTR